MNRLRVEPVRRPLDADVAVPGSKSITNRALVCAAFAAGRSVLANALVSDDTTYMLEALGKVGIAVEHSPEKAEITVDGGFARIDRDLAEPLYVGNAGTAMRFLAAALAATGHRFELTGSARMRERPIADLVDALVALGGDVYCREGNGCPPVVIRGRGLAGGRVSVPGDVSSQFLSALCLAAPYARADVGIEVTGELVSRPYVAMTLAVMEAFGVQGAADDAFTAVRVGAGQRYAPRAYRVESDASSASYFLAAAAVAGGRVRVTGLSFDSLQGDVEFARLLGRMGADVTSGPDWIEVRGGARLRGIEVDMRHVSDVALTLAVVALFATGPTVITGVGNMRLKETDRLRALATELGKLGAAVEERPDGLVIVPAAAYRPAVIETYDDHRMAMSFAVAGLAIPGVEILDPGCVAKTFPDFFRVFAAMRGDA